MHKTEGESEAVILVKAATQAGRRHEEAICCAGVTPQGEWVRLYPVSFRFAEDAKRFSRWDKIRFRWRASADDPRPESRLIEQNSIEIFGKLPFSERHEFLSRLEVKALNTPEQKGKSLALLRPRNARFMIERKTDREITEEERTYESVVQQTALSGAIMINPQKPCPYRFKYKYSIDDGDREEIYQDWNINAAFSNLSRSFGEAQTLSRIVQLFGKEYPKKGMVFALEKHAGSEAWQIHTIISMDEVYETTGHCLNVVA
jgi:hypothetical protein